MKIINLTPHTINLVLENGTRAIEPSGKVARVSATTVKTGFIDDVPTSATEYGEVIDLPEPKEGVVYVVSSLVAARVPSRNDVYIPNESVRDEDGRIIGCRSLGRV